MGVLSFIESLMLFSRLGSEWAAEEIRFLACPEYLEG
jgi:hypothetical protein